MFLLDTFNSEFIIFFRETFTACVGAAGSLFSLILVLNFIPKSTKSEASTANTQSKTHLSLLHLISFTFSDTAHRCGVLNCEKLETKT